MTSRLGACLGLFLTCLAPPCAAVTAAEVIEQNKPLEPMMCEAVRLEQEMADVVRNSGVPVQELMRRDINEDSPVVRSIKRITERIQGLVDANMPVITRVREMQRKLSPAEHEKLNAYLQGMMKKCQPR